jgi:hypothetical protein
LFRFGDPQSSLNHEIIFLNAIPLSECYIATPAVPSRHGLKDGDGSYIAVISLSSRGRWFSGAECSSACYKGHVVMANCRRQRRDLMSACRRLNND